METLTEKFGPGAPSLGKLPDLEGKPAALLEPWMAEFVRGKHSMEEWEAFFEYCAAGRVKRYFMVIAAALSEIW
jgi:hypothetical protein